MTYWSRVQSFHVVVSVGQNHAVAQEAVTGSLAAGSDVQELNWDDFAAVKGNEPVDRADKFKSLGSPSASWSGRSWT